MNTGLVSVIIPVFNRATMLLEAVDSVLNQTYQHIEIIIIDDGSTDDTLGVAQQLSKQHGSIRTLSIQNSGPGAARQCGLNDAQGEFIQFLDSDDLVHPDKLAIQTAGLKTHPLCDVAYCRQDLCGLDGTLIETAWMRTGESHNTMFPAMLGGRLWGTPVPLYRRSILDQIGPWLTTRCEEDWEYDCRVAAKSSGLLYSPQTLVTIRRHDEGHLGDQLAKPQQQFRDRLKAYTSILASAFDGGVSPGQAEMERFSRMAFMQARRAGRYGLPKESSEFIKLAIRATQSVPNKLELRSYQGLAHVVSHSFIGMLSEKLDRFRK